MTQSASQSRAPSVLPLAGVCLLAVVCSEVVAFGLGRFNVWAEHEALILAALLSGAVVLAGLVNGLVVLTVGVRNTPERLPMLIVAAGVVRMLIGLFVGLAVYLIVRPEGRTFWFGFLIAGLVCLMVETAWGLAGTRRVFAGPDSAANGVDS